MPDGSYTYGLPREAEQAALVGELVAYWTNVEEQMIQFLGLLLGDRKLPIRQIFRSLPSEQARIKLLIALLEEAPINNDKGKEYDDVITRFKSLNRVRNKYVHGLWSFHQQSGRVYLAEASADEFQMHDPREVTADELRANLKEMGNLWKEVFRLTNPEGHAALWPEASQKSKAPQRASKPNHPPRSKKKAQ